MKIDRAYLLSLSPRPCESGLAAFDAAFPDGLLVEGDLDDATLDKLRGLDLGWFAATLPTEAGSAYNQATAEARAAYNQAKAEAGAAYRRALAEAWAAYDRATAEAWAAYDRALAEAWAAWERAVAEAWAAYDRAVARALWRIVAALEVSS